MKFAVLLLTLFIAKSYATTEYAVSIYSPLIGSSVYSDLDGTVDEDDAAVSANNLSYMLKVNYMIDEYFSVGIETGRFSYNVNYTSDSHFTKSYTTDVPVGLALNHLMDKHRFTLVMANTRTSDGSKYFDNNSFDGLLEYGYRFKSNIAVNIRHISIEGGDGQNNELSVNNTVTFFGFSFYL
jgi:hypothetical protein